MTRNEWRRRFILALCRLSVVLDSPQTDERLRLYCEALRSTRIEALEWACREAETRFRFFPRPVELRELAALAPVKILRLDVPVTAALMEKPTDRAEALKRLGEIFSVLNGRFGTGFRA